MSSMWCDNPGDHEREGRRDYERHGRYGYDSQQYNDHWNDCAKHYQHGFDEARREDERRQERFEEEQAEQRRHERQAQQRRYEEECRQQEQEYYEAQQREAYEQYCREQAQEQEQDMGKRLVVSVLLPALNWSRKRIRKWARREGVKLA